MKYVLFRAIKSIIYHVRYTLVLFIAMIVMSAMLLVNLSFLSSCIGSAEKTGQQVGAILTLSNNSSTTDKQDLLDFRRNNSIKMSIVNEVLGMDYGVSEPRITVYSGSNIINFNMKITDKQKMTYPNESAVKIIGISYSADDPDFITGNLDLLKGKHIDDSSLGKVIISQHMAENNNLDIGDTIEIGSLYSEYTCTLIIDGIFLDTVGYSNNNNPFYDPSNWIYTRPDTVIALNGEDRVAKATFHLSNPDSNIVTEINELPIDTWIDKYITPVFDDTEYRSVMASFNNSIGISKIFTVFTIILSVAVSGIIVFLLLKSREFEMGVLISIGESKLNIFIQLFTEIFVPSMIGVFLGVVLSFTIVNYISVGITQNTTVVPQINMENIMVIAISFIGVIILSSLVSAYKLIAYKPKKILIDME